MPTYEYECLVHGRFELTIDWMRRDAVRCPEVVIPEGAFVQTGDLVLVGGLLGYVCNLPCKRLPHYSSVQISVPVRFRDSMISDWPQRPSSPEVAANWERDGVTPPGGTRWL